MNFWSEPPVTYWAKVLCPVALPLQVAFLQFCHTTYSNSTNVSLVFSARFARCEGSVLMLGTGAAVFLLFAVATAAPLVHLCDHDAHVASEPLTGYSPQSRIPQEGPGYTSLYRRPFRGDTARTIYANYQSVYMFIFQHQGSHDPFCTSFLIAIVGLPSSTFAASLPSLMCLFYISITIFPDQAPPRLLHRPHSALRGHLSASHLRQLHSGAGAHACAVSVFLSSS